jgi:hypothetical protein
MTAPPRPGASRGPGCTPYCETTGVGSAVPGRSLCPRSTTSSRAALALGAFAPEVVRAVAPVLVDAAAAAKHVDVLPVIGAREDRGPDHHLAVAVYVADLDAFSLRARSTLR